MPTAYGIAFKGKRFLMVFNTKRNGWEMPGGSLEGDECPEEAVIREFYEEAGYDIDILASKDIDDNVCVSACILLEKLNDSPEMESELFAELPDNLAFDRTEYETVLPWARAEAAGVLIPPNARICLK